jgi:hypothetical protein
MLFGWQGVTRRQQQQQQLQQQQVQGPLWRP